MEDFLKFHANKYIIETAIMIFIYVCGVNMLVYSSITEFDVSVVPKVSDCVNRHKAVFK